MIGDNAHRVKQSIQIDLPNGQRTLAVNTVRDVYRRPSQEVASA